MSKKNEFSKYISSITRFQIILLLIFTILLNIFLNYIGYLNRHAHVATRVVKKNEKVLTNKKGDIIKYPDLLECTHQFNNSWMNEADKNNYQVSANLELHNYRITRAVIVYYPAHQFDYFEQEFRWFYRSWTEALKFEPKLWRTDLIIFLDHRAYLSTQNTLFQELNCSITNLRKSKKNEPMCTIIDYISIRERNIPLYNESYFQNVPNEDIYRYLFRKVNVFDESPQNLW
jgi:hypothetical protein